MKENLQTEPESLPAIRVNRFAISLTGLDGRIEFIETIGPKTYVRSVISMSIDDIQDLGHICSQLAEKHRADLAENLKKAN